MANKRCNYFWDLNDGAILKKLELKLEGGLSDVSGLNGLENLTFTPSMVKINFLQFSPIKANFICQRGFFEFYPENMPTLILL